MRKRLSINYACLKPERGNQIARIKNGRYTNIYVISLVNFNIVLRLIQSWKDYGEISVLLFLSIYKK